MRSLSDIKELLEELEITSAGELEDQDLDFKEWNQRRLKDAVALLVEMAVCMANGGGGTVVFGVNDRAIGRPRAILGVPPEVDVNRLKKAVYDSTDPKLTPVFEELHVPEGTGRVLIMQVHPGLPPYTDTAGRGTVRIGKDCMPLTGTLRRRLAIETGETDFTAEVIPDPPTDCLSATALEQLREAARRERAPEELLRLSDIDLLMALGVVRSGGEMTRAAVFLAGSERAIRRHIHGYVWTHLRMKSDTQYTDRADASDALPVALHRMLDRINADNPITTLEQGLFHFEYRAYPEVALREALLNALSHADLRLGAPILVKQYPDRLEISNSGGFIGGITPENILHHPPVARNPTLVDALAKLRLVNRSNLGVGRMFEAFLIEGKEPPAIREIGESVVLTFRRRELSASFRLFVAEESQQGRNLNVDHLLILQHLLHHPEIDTAAACRLCQREEAQVREILTEMEQPFSYLERGGTGRGTYWTVRPEIYHRLAGPDHPQRDRRIDWEAAKTRILSVLIERARRGEPGLRNEDIRRITHYDRFQAIRLMKELKSENPGIRGPGRGRNAVYLYSEDLER